jgi:hypothetical protein
MLLKCTSTVQNEEEKIVATRNIRQWCVNALLEGDAETQDVIRAVARDKLGMMDKKKMQAEDIGAMLKLFNILPTSFLGMKSFMETFWGFRMFDSKTAIQKLYQDAVVPRTGVTQDELKVAYWYKEMKEVLLLFLHDQVKYSRSVLEEMR